MAGASAAPAASRSEAARRSTRSRRTPTAPPPSRARPTRLAAIAWPWTRARRAPSSRATAPTAGSCRARPPTTASRPGAPTAGASCSPASPRMAMPICTCSPWRRGPRGGSPPRGPAPAWSTRNRIAYVNGYSQVVGRPRARTARGDQPGRLGPPAAHAQERARSAWSPHGTKIAFVPGPPVRDEGERRRACGECAANSRSRPRTWRGRPTATSSPAHHPSSPESSS